MNFIDVVPEQIETISRHRYTAGVSMCIPAYNEEATIEEAIRSAAATLQRSGLAGEILVLDDCSADRTWAILQRLKGAVPNLQIRRHETNQGIAKTFTELYHWASMDLVFLNSADGQWNMNILIDMLPLMKDSDLVIARRKHKHYRLNRRIVSWLFNVLPTFLFGTKTYDAGSIKLVRHQIYDIPLKSHGVFAEAERIIRATRLGYRVGFVDVEHFPRKSGKATGAKFSLVIEALVDVCRCWIDIVLLRR
jgi:glycosyltransferase involved in cell wall biosynthesis